MAILHRIQRLLRADAHAALDALEEPDALLKQAVREMQESLDLEGAAFDRNRQALAVAEKRISALKEELGQAEKDLALALQQGAEELCRKCIARKLALAKRLKLLQRRSRDLDETCRRQCEQIEKRRGQLEEILDRARTQAWVSDESSSLGLAQGILRMREDQVWGGDRPARAEVSQEEIELEWIRLRSDHHKGGER